MRHLLTAVALLAVTAVPAAAQVIDFDGTGAPCAFAETVPLTTQYSAQGFTFSGHGSILNQCSGFPSGAAHSGTNFAAYNQQVGPASESITVSGPENYFDFYLGSTPLATVTFYVGVQPFSIFVVTGSMSGWSRWTFGGLYNRVDIQSSSGVMTLDDISIHPVVAAPEPASLALFATGLIGVGAFTRRRKHVA
jgi:hypothetical protein